MSFYNVFAAESFFISTRLLGSCLTFVFFEGGLCCGYDMPDRGGSLFSHGIGQFFDRSLHRAVPTNSGPINLETDTMRRVMRGPLFTPHWSPSGNRLVFHSPIPQYLFTVGTDGRNLQKLTGPDSPNLDLENTVIASGALLVSESFFRSRRVRSPEYSP